VRQEDLENLEMGHHLKVALLSVTLNPTWVSVVLEASRSLIFIPSPTSLKVTQYPNDENTLSKSIPDTFFSNSLITFNFSHKVSFLTFEQE
jgi:hypothetical protein